MLRFVSPVLLLVACLPPAMAGDARKDRETLAAIIRAAEARQERCQSVRMVAHAESWSSPDQVRNAQRQAPDANVPDRFLESGFRIRGHSSIAFDGTRVRHHLEGDSPRPPQWDVLERYEYIQVFDGQWFMHMSPPNENRNHWVIRNREQGRNYLHALPLPMLAYVRLRDSNWVSAAATVWGIAEKRVRIGTSDCVVVAFGDGISEFAFDPDNHWVLRRFLRPERDRDSREIAAEEIEIEYSQPRGIDSRPIGWKHQFRKQGKVQSEGRIKVIEWAVNPQWPPETFAIRFPERSFVTEESAGKKPGPTSFVIDGEGKRIDLTAELLQDQAYLKLLK
jgi:hypothetical protein